MPRLDLDTAAFATCAAAARDAATTLGGVSLSVPAAAVGDPLVAEALAQVRRAWTSDVGALVAQLDDVAAALGAAGRTFDAAESDVAGTLAALLGAAQ